MRSNKGINMITLSIAVIILVIITSVLVFNAKDGVKIKTLSNMYNDIEMLENKVSSYYLEHGDVPGHVVYANEEDGTNSEFISMLENAEMRNPNDENTYLVIDLKSLEGVSLNYGRDYDQVSDNSDATSLKDLYVINKISHTIYYPRGIEIEGKTYYTSQTEYSKVDMSVIPIYTAQEMSWVGDGQLHAIAEEDGTEYTFALNGTYILKNDIDLSSVCYKVDGTSANDVSWTPIGTLGNPFSGKFYGNGYEIKNIYININNNTEKQASLFGYAKDALINETGITGKIILSSTSRSSSASGITGAFYGGKIRKCYNKANIETISQNGQSGGIIGCVNSTVELQNCYNKGQVTARDYAGGLIGGDYRSTNIIRINNSWNDGSVVGENNGVNRAGGILGWNLGTAHIENVYNTGNIIGSTRTGGILGYGEGQSEIIKSYNSGKITGTFDGMIFVGGIGGYINTANTKIVDCYNTGYIIGTAINHYGYFGGIAGETKGEVLMCYNNGIVKGENSNQSRMGGITGVIETGTSKVSNCYNAGRIELENETGTGKQIMRGISGYGWTDGGIIENCYNIVSFKYGNTLKSNYRIGGIVGTNEGTSSIKNSYYLDTLASSITGEGTNNVTNCTSKTSEEMKAATFISILETDNTEPIWLPDTTNMNSGYPILAWQMDE